MSDVFVATSAFGADEVIKKGQGFYFPIVAGAGAVGVEIRGELLSEKDGTFKELGRLVRECNLAAVYSKPMGIWNAEGELNKQQIHKSITEAQELGAKMVKFSLGKYDGVSSNIDDLKELFENLRENNYEIQVTVENDQTSDGGNVKALNRFFQDCSARDIQVGMTFDIGNWSFTGENACDAAEVLGKYVVYIHCKHVEHKLNKLITVPLSEEMSSMWRKVLDILPKNAAKTIEFPLNGENIEKVTKKYVQLLANS